MADEKDKIVVVSRGGEVVPDPAIFDGEERRFTENPSPQNPQTVTAAQYDQLKGWKDSEGRQLLVKKGGK